MSVELVSIAAGVIVGAVFVVAGVYKLTDGDAWPRQAADMGVPREVAVVVPWVEIGLGALTAAHVFGPIPAIALLGTLLIFTVLIVIRLLDGSRPPCACFGSRSSRPLGAYHVIRNLVLGVLAVVTIAGA